MQQFFSKLNSGICVWLEDTQLLKATEFMNANMRRFSSFQDLEIALTKKCLTLSQANDNYKRKEKKFAASGKLGG